MNSQKIEVGAIVKLQDIILRHNLMDDHINQKDKEPSWDGYIYLYTSHEQKVEHLKFRVPVQIKGTCNENHLKRQGITFPIEYKHLRNYHQDGGVFFIVISISEDREHFRLFYNPLTAIKLEDLLKNTQLKAPNQKKSIPLQRLDKNSGDTLFKLLLQFGSDKEKQGSGNGEIIKKAINKDAMSIVDSIKASSFSATSNEDIFRGISSGEVTLYGHLSDADIWVPFDYSHQKEIIITSIRPIMAPIVIEGTTYYDSYHVEKIPSTNNEPILKVSENLTIDLFNKKITFTPIGTLDTLVNDSHFLRALEKNLYVYINGTKVTFTSISLGRRINALIEQSLDLGTAFAKIQFECTKKFRDFSEQDWDSIKQLLDLQRQQVEISNGIDNTWLTWWWDDKIFPLFITQRSGKPLEYSIWHSQDIRLFVKKDKEYTMPNFCVFDRYLYKNIHEFDEQIWYKEADKIEYCQDTHPDILLLFVELLSAYMSTNNELFFKLSEVMIDNLLAVLPEDELVIINKLLLIKLKRNLIPEEITSLETLANYADTSQVRMAANILLENKYEARKIFSSLSPESQKEMESFPIYQLL